MRQREGHQEKLPRNRILVPKFQAVHQDSGNGPATLPCINIAIGQLERGIGLTFPVNVDLEVARPTVVCIAGVLHMPASLAPASSMGCWLGALVAEEAVLVCGKGTRCQYMRAYNALTTEQCLA